MQKELLIVGAGITGSLVASLLSKAQSPTNITVWDKAGLILSGICVIWNLY